MMSIIKFGMGTSMMWLLVAQCVDPNRIYMGTGFETVILKCLRNVTW